MTGREGARWRIAYMLLLVVVSAAIGVMLYEVRRSDLDARERLKASILLSCDRGNTLRANQRAVLQGLISLTDDVKKHATSPQLRRDAARRLPDLQARLKTIRPVDCATLVK